MRAKMRGAWAIGCTLAEFKRVLSKKFKRPPDRIRAAEAVFEGVPVVPKPPKSSTLEIRVVPIVGSWQTQRPVEKHLIRALKALRQALSKVD